jgi:hypothetical protein
MIWDLEFETIEMIKGALELERWNDHIPDSKMMEIQTEYRSDRQLLRTDKKDRRLYLQYR